MVGRELTAIPLGVGTNLGSWETMRLLLPNVNADADKLFETLLPETAKMRKAKQLEPTGTRWVTYTRPLDIFKLQRTKKRVRHETRHYTVARFALSQCRAGNSYSPALIGKTADEIPRAGHQHAHFLATDENSDGRLDHITIYAPCGLNPHDQEAVGQLRFVRRYKNLPNVRTTLIGLGTKADFSGVSIFKASKRWRSVVSSLFSFKSKV